MLVAVPNVTFSTEMIRMSRFSFRLLPLCIALALTVFAVEGQEPRPAAERQANDSVVAQAESLLNAGKPDAAIEMLNVSAQSKPADPQVNCLLGQAYYQKGDYAHSTEFLSMAVKQLPADGQQYRQGVKMLALSHYLLGHLKEAIPYLEQVAWWAPNNIEIAYGLGISYIQTRDPDKSRREFARMFKVQPTSAAAYLINAQMMVRQRFEELAEQELKKALELNPKLPQANFLLGEMAIYHADIERGIALLQKEIEINPSFAMAYYWLGEAYTRQLKWDEAIGPLQKSVWLNPYFSGPYIVLGKVYLKTGDMATAESMLRRAVQMDPNNFSAHNLLAQVLQRANRSDEAKREFELAEKLRTSAEKDQ
jgi:tetratricopeptide (TPR) repeat protein